MRANGTFEVKMHPQPADEAAPRIGRMALDKRFKGDLEATSKGQMLMSAGSVQGSAGYVAIEQVSGNLHGRSGGFVLQHTGVMTRGTPELTIRVVPDSGSEELSGLRGSMRIRIEGGQHSYEFEYDFAE